MTVDAIAGERNERLPPAGDRGHDLSAEDEDLKHAAK